MNKPSPRPGLVQVSLSPESPIRFLGLRGELDLSSIGEVPRDAYAERTDLTTVLVDLGELAFCDVTGLRALVELRREQEAQGRSVSIVRANPFIWRMLRPCGLTDRLDFERSADTTV